eukprot:scaffold74182_cov38-Phaeocystis_antarctica.AAC.1
MRVGLSVRREAVLDTRLRLKAVQVRREDAVHGEDPRAEVRGGIERQGGAGRSARTSQAQTVAERLRNQGAWVHEEIGPARPLADLRHV